MANVTAAAFAGAAAIFFRQTNVVWVAFAFGLSCLRALEGTSSWKTRICYPPLPEQIRPSFLSPIGWFGIGLVAEAPRLVLESGRGLLLLPCIAFVYFVLFVNGGSIVVGDYENHTGSLATKVQIALPRT